tara:strand:+ start:117 stop:287 length:171 start_codon:yes stop_codon:yes gene_type:complete
VVLQEAVAVLQETGVKVLLQFLQHKDTLVVLGSQVLHHNAVAEAVAQERLALPGVE